MLYLSYGHCAGKHDMNPLNDIVPSVRGSWNSPTHYELLQRGINWGSGLFKTRAFSEHKYLRLDKELYASSLAAMTPKQLSGLGIIVIRLKRV